mmetsp:Transcript_16415/g.24201  ORF Transcript_16415/g.24201 Transcript_16415/m.24201 type:complete len:523 (+) Transcript_16415:124-1692(+)
MSLRARKQQSFRNNAALVAQRRHVVSTSSDAPGIDEKRSKLIFFTLFLGVCVFGGIREYLRNPSGSSNLKGQSEVRIYLSEGKNNSNFHSLLNAEEDSSLEFNHDDNTRYHVIFSTDCSPYQHWQSYLVYFSAMKIRQPGHVTRIASGCEGEDKTAMEKWFQDHIQGMSSRFHLHMTPHFSGVKNEQGETVGEYKFFNKPFGLKHWLEHADHFSLQQIDDIVILIDPDMILTRPILGDFSSETDTLIAKMRQPHILGRRVEHGLPFAQTYGFGAQWEKLDLDQIAGADSPAKLVDKMGGRLHYTVGPPYLATVQDMYQIALKWSEFVPLVHKQYPNLLAEMFAFSIAAAHLELKHQVIDSLMVSDTEIQGGEGWPLVDRIPNGEMCSFAKNHHQDSEYVLPSVLHMCQRYSVGNDWFFGKRRFPQDFFTCDHPLLKEPPDNLATAFDFKKPPNAPEPTELSPKLANRESFMVCFLTAVANEAATFFKKQACKSEKMNVKKSLKMVELFESYKEESQEETSER